MLAAHARNENSAAKIQQGENKMIILPAIDLLDGNCVRLKKGEYGSAEKVAASAVDTARGFEKAGAEYIHTVDLNGAKDGLKTNHELICEIAKSIGIPLQTGGGIRDIETVGYYLKNGVSRVILGSAAVKNPDFLKKALEMYGDKIAVGIDFLDGMVRVSGWTEKCEENYLSFAGKMASFGVKNIICTDISKDGMLGGIDGSLYAGLKEVYPHDITASGGVRDIDDIKRLKSVGIYGAICGKSIYSGTLDLEEAINETKKKEFL